MREGLTSPAGSFAEGRAFTFPLGHGAESFYPCIYGEPGSKEPQVSTNYRQRDWEESTVDLLDDTPS